MNELDYGDLSNTELIPLLELPADKDGLRYYIPKAAKVEMLQGVTSERQTEILTAARASQQEHHRNLATRRSSGSIDRGKAVEAKLSGATWKFVEQRRIAGKFRDACTGRKAVVAYVLQNLVTAERIQLTRSTVNYAHDTLRNIQNWPPKAGRRTSVEAASAGVVTAASLPD